jgi:protein TonB
MNQERDMRYSASMMVAIGICFITFLGMAFLVSTPKYTKSSNLEMISFSKVTDMKQPIVKHITKKEPPKREKVKQPPAVKPLDITDNPGRPIVPFIPHQIEGKVLELPKTGIPTLSQIPTTDSGDTNSAMQQMFMIQPMYPPQAARNKIEGWVKVEFTVTALGTVTNAKIINSKPRRVFDTATLRALRKSKFKPLMVDGKARAQKAVQIIEFKLQD